MAKKKARRKLSSRVKRTIRKTSAVVLMAAAVAVAAIPAGKIEAEERPTNKGVVVNDNRGRYSYLSEVEGDNKDDRNGVVNEAHEVEPDSQSGEGTYYPKLQTSKKAKMLSMSHRNPSAEYGKSYTIMCDDKGTFYFDWQFEYDGNVLCRYNPQFDQTVVELPSFLSDQFYRIRKDFFDAFFQSGKGQSISYNYDEWKNEDYADLDVSNKKKIFMKFDKLNASYQGMVKQWTAFDAEVAKIINELQNDNETNPDIINDQIKALKNARPGDENLDELGISGNYPTYELVIGLNEQPMDIKKQIFCMYFDPKDAVSSDPESRLKSLSQYDQDLEFMLEEVHDKTQAGDDNDGYAPIEYFVKYVGTKNLTGVSLLDVNTGGSVAHFLVPGTTTYEINCIADYAFKGVQKVEQLILNERIYDIGDYAFADSFLQGIDMPNVEVIGNAAFKGCRHLKSVKFGRGLKAIGAEAFYGCEKMEVVEFSSGVNRIGAGAFAKCTSMEKLDLSKLGSCDMDEAVFYGAQALTEVVFPGDNDTGFDTLGKAAFAVNGLNKLLNVVLPTNLGSLPEYLFAGRTALKTVTMPATLGDDKPATIPATLFVGCTDLERVVFPETAKFVNYSGKTSCEDANGNKMDIFTLFLDVNNDKFVVEGPAFSDGMDPAYERRDTWYCITNVNNYVPYVYKVNDVENYEVSDEDYILTANNNELLSCQLKYERPIDLVIPAAVGENKIEQIANGCFDNTTIKRWLRSLTIENGTVSAIQPEVFKDMQILEWVDLGNSVTDIGARAFYNCKKLENVTFRAEQVTLGEEAFVTNSDKLTFHGKIDKEFGPFVWATDKDNLISERGKRVCYKSNSPTYLTVMYDDGTNEVTLLDYPKYNDLDKLHAQEFVEMWYSVYKDKGYDDRRRAFYNAWSEAVSIKDPIARKAAILAVYEKEFYGPWVNPDFCSDVATGKYQSAKAEPEGAAVDQNLSAKTEQLLDRLLPAVKAYAANLVESEDRPIPYFSHEDHRYSIVNKNTSTGKEWDQYTTEESALISACEDIVVPAGVQSIDAATYFANPKNSINVTTYFLDEDIDISMYSNSHAPGADGKQVYPGLFSGWYIDYDTQEERNEFERCERGNDHVRSITLEEVKSLPMMAFDSCERLNKVVFGESLIEIKGLPFYGCTSLETVKTALEKEGAAENPFFKVENGLVLDVQEGEGKYVLIECLPKRGNGAGSASVPDESDETDRMIVSNIAEIEKRAFEDCDNIGNVDFRESTVKVIPEGCFKDCDKLAFVYLPVSTDSINAEAFKDDNSVWISIPSREVFIATNAFEHGADAKNEPGHGTVRFHTYLDSAAREYADYYGITWTSMAEMHHVMFVDYDGNPLTDVYVTDGEAVTKDQIPEPPVREGYDFVEWISNGETPIYVNDRINKDVIFHPTYKALAGTHGGKYYVIFYDGVNGKQLGDRQEVEPGTSVAPPEVPKHSKYTFLKWSTEEYKNVQQDLIVTALYKPKKASTSSKPGGDSSSGGGGDNSGNSSDNKQEEEKKETKKYNVTVKNGTGSGSYEKDATVAIVANTPEAGKVFSKWTTDDKEVTFVNAAMSATTFKMPEKDVTVTAEYVDSAATTTAVAAPTTNSTYYPPGYSGSGTTYTDTGAGTGGNNSGNNNNAQVVVSKPGISNIDIATAKVNGSSDSFVIKVSETNDAEEKVRSALTNRYGSVDDRIKYWACDITLYDETGNTKIKDTTGLTVDITLPIPDELRSYGANAMVGAVADNVLESLTPRFNEINGVPCVTFTATHFSPYTIYVDTQNLSASQMLDATPKTGDPIHPKWFLSVGLAAVSLLLFMKKDKKKYDVLRTA